MTKAAKAITRGTESCQLVTPRPPQPRTGWVYEVVVLLRQGAERASGLVERLGYGATHCFGSEANPGRRYDQAHHQQL